jgi:hypothetical protein
MNDTQVIIENPELKIQAGEDGVWLHFKTCNGNRYSSINLSVLFDGSPHSAICDNTIQQWAKEYAELHQLSNELSTTETIDIVFDGPPSHESGRFVEVEDQSGKSINIGKWIDRKDGYWALRIKASRKE